LPLAAWPPKREITLNPQREPHNPFYLLLLLASFVFVITALAIAIVPVLEDKANLAGATVPASPFRTALRDQGWQWLLYQVAAMIVFGLASMGLDRLRRLQKERSQAKIPPSEQTSPSP
jgi:hypothetical protein